MRIAIDRGKCCGSGMCVLTAPEVFDQDEQDGLVVLRATRPPDDRDEAVREAAALCPAGAIEVSD